MISANEITPLISEASRCLNNPVIKKIFTHSDSNKIFNEVSVANTHSTRQINIIDKLIISNELAWIIDFKTQANVTKENAISESKKFSGQLKRYAENIKLLYPTLPIQCSVVFTKIPLLVDVDVLLE